MALRAATASRMAARSAGIWSMGLPRSTPGVVVGGGWCCVCGLRSQDGAPVRLGTGTTPGARLQMGAAESNYLLRLSVPLGILAGLRRIVWLGLGRVTQA